MKVRAAVLLSMAWALAAMGPAYAGDHGSPERGAKKLPGKDKTMTIRLTVNGKAIIATLDDNPTARDFLSLLPMTLDLEDYAATEKISYLSRKLSTAGAPPGADPAPGDIAYYAPWGNLAIFYRDFGYSSGLIKLGRIEAGLEELDVRGSLRVTIEDSEKQGLDHDMGERYRSGPLSSTRPFL
jgi:hypothetical protein